MVLRINGRYEYKYLRERRMSPHLSGWAQLREGAVSQCSMRCVSGRSEWDAYALGRNAIFYFRPPVRNYVIILVRAGLTRCHRLGGLNHRNYVSQPWRRGIPSSESGKFSVWGKSFSPGFQTTWSPCTLTWQRERLKANSLVSLISPSRGLLPHDLT